MDREIVGEVLDHLSVAEDVSRIWMMLVIGERGIDDGIDIGFGRPTTLPSSRMMERPLKVLYVASNAV